MMNHYIARKGYSIWKGKQLIARFNPIGGGIFTFTTNQVSIIKHLETDPYYKGELQVPEYRMVKTFLPNDTKEIQVMIPVEGQMEATKGGELVQKRIPYNMVVPANIDSFWKIHIAPKKQESNIVQGPQTSVNSIQGKQEQEDINIKTDAAQKVIIKRINELEVQCLTKAGKWKKDVDPALIEELKQLKGETL